MMIFRSLCNGTASGGGSGSDSDNDNGDIEQEMKICSRAIFLVNHIPQELLDHTHIYENDVTDFKGNQINAAWSVFRLSPYVTAKAAMPSKNSEKRCNYLPSFTMSGEMVSEKCCITGASHIPTNRDNSRADFEIRPLGVASKKDMGARKKERCNLLKSMVAVLYPTMKRIIVLARLQKELPIAKATKTTISVKLPTGGSIVAEAGVAQAIQ
ncbi:ABC transporter C family member 3 [Senna tora]|uniref:ABC transporter C family member 3 n=1 Tax=Senna tora TaxID=362788 RepID=A0A834TPF5_9FABA|nr:ABC transporter C family member 3 [Senna tora]